jgi:hypothetical protein
MVDEPEEKIVTASNSVCFLSVEELAARFEAVMNPRGIWKGESAEPLRFMCRMLASEAIDYFASAVQTGEKLQ